MEIQSSSKSCPMEMRDPVVRSLKTWADCALGESLVDMFKVDCRFVLMALPFATCTVGPDLVCKMWAHCGR